MKEIQIMVWEGAVHRSGTRRWFWGLQKAGRTIARCSLPAYPVRSKALKAALAIGKQLGGIQVVIDG